jgi:hypothetical protein
MNKDKKGGHVQGEIAPDGRLKSGADLENQRKHKCQPSVIHNKIRQRTNSSLWQVFSVEQARRDQIIRRQVVLKSKSKRKIHPITLMMLHPMRDKSSLSLAG